MIGVNKINNKQSNTSLDHPTAEQNRRMEKIGEFCATNFFVLSYFLFLRFCDTVGDGTVPVPVHKFTYLHHRRHCAPATDTVCVLEEKEEE